MLGGHGEDPLGDLVAARDTTEDVDEDGLHALVREDDLERRLDHRLLRAAAHVEEVRGAPARVAHRVERSHDEAGAVPDDPHIAVELHVAEAERARFLFGLLVLRHLLERGELFLAEERVVIDIELRVSREHRAVLLHEERVDLDEHRVGAPVHGEQALRYVHDRIALGLRDARLEGERARRERQQAKERARPAARDPLRRARRDLLDVHATDGREHHDGTAAVTVERDPEIELGGDVRRALDVDLVNAQSFEVHPEDRLRGLARLGRRLRDLDAAGLSATADLDLRLHRDGGADRFRGGLGLLR